MPAELRFTAQHFDDLRRHLLPDDAEHAAVLVCGVGGPTDELLRCRRVIPLTDQDLESSSGRLHLHISPMALARVAKQAGREACTVVVCHSHPFPGLVRASSIDLDTERELCGRVLPGRLEGRPVGALILGPDGMEGRLWAGGLSHPLTVRVAGVAIDTDVVVEGAAEDGRDARHLLVWGAIGQQRLRRAHVALVGVGGTVPM